MISRFVFLARCWFLGHFFECMEAIPVKIGVLGDCAQGFMTLRSCLRVEAEPADTDPLILHARRGDGNRLASFHFWNFSGDVFRQNPGMCLLMSSNASAFLIFCSTARSAESPLLALRRFSALPVAVVIDSLTP